MSNTTENLKRFPYRDKNTDGSVCYRVMFQYFDKDGIKQTAPKQRFATKKEAKARLDELKLEHHDQKHRFNPKEKDKATFSGYAKVYLDELLPTLQPSAHGSVKSTVAGLIEYFKDKKLELIRRAEIKAFKKYIIEKPVVVEMKTEKTTKFILRNDGGREWIYKKVAVERPRSASSTNHYLRRLRHLLNTAARDDIIDAPNFSGFVEPGKEIPRSKTVSYGELEDLINACTGKKLEHLKLVLIGLFELGARLCELQAIRRRDINFEQKTCFVPNSKKRLHSAVKPRLCYASKFLLNALRAAGIEQLEPDTLVFTQGEFKRSFQTVKTKAGVDADLTLKDFRHCFPTNANAAGVDQMFIERQLGHNLSESLLKSVYTNPRADYLVYEMRKYELFSADERRKLVVRKEITEYTQDEPETLDFSFLPTFQTQTK